MSTVRYCYLQYVHCSALIPCGVLAAAPFVGAQFIALLPGASLPGMSIPAVDVPGTGVYTYPAPINCRILLIEDPP